MIEVEWSNKALFDLDEVLLSASSPKGAETIKRSIRIAAKTISLAPRSGRFVQKFGWYEAVVGKAPFLLIYRLVSHPDGTRARIIAVFNTRRDPKRKPRGRR